MRYQPFIGISVYLLSAMLCNQLYSQNRKRDSVLLNEERKAMPVKQVTRPAVSEKIDSTSDGRSGTVVFSIPGPNPVKLEHVIHSYSADCNSKQAEVGDYEWNGDTLCLYTYWLYDGDPAGQEWGARKILFVWNGQRESFRKIYSEVYLEINAATGFEYLKTDNRNCDSCSAARKKYIDNVAENKKAKFVTGNKKNALIKLVQEKLKDQITETAAGFYCKTGFGCRIWK